MKDPAGQIELVKADPFLKGENAKLMARLKRDADRICVHFGLTLKELKAERRGVRSRYGACYEDGRVLIRLRHATHQRPLRYSSLVNTLCHELAHLKHFNHGPHFKAFYFEILRFARDAGIYNPRALGQKGNTPAPVGGEQLLLFRRKGDPR